MTATTATTATRDHTISTAAAATLLGVKPQTVARYLRAGKIARLGDGISAASVEAYRQARDANIARTRAVPGWRRRPAGELRVLPAPASPLEEAAAALAEAARLEALARALKAKARPVLEEAGPGVYGRYEVRFTPGRKVLDTAAVRADYAARGAEPPMKQGAPAIKVGAAPAAA